MTLNQKYFVDPVERAGSTFVQQFAIFMLAAGGSLLLSQNFLAAADSAGFAAIIALITSYVLILTGIKVTGWFDVGRRVILTFAQSFSGTLLANGVTHSVLHAGWTAALAIALNVAGVAFLKSLIGLSLPHTIGGSVVDANAVQVSPDMNYDMADTKVIDFTPVVDFTALQDGAVGGADPSKLMLNSPLADYNYDSPMDDHVAEHAALDDKQA